MPMELIGIHGVPRSGTSWLAQIFRSCPSVLLRFQPLFSYAFKGRLTPVSSRDEILDFFDELRDTQDAFVLQKDPNIHVEYPEFEEQLAATHLVYKEVRYNHILRNLTAQVPELKLIGLVRHPCAVIDSWINAPREFKPEWSVDEEWRSGALKNQGRPEECFGFDKWKEVAELFLALEAELPGQVRVVRYADLNADPVRVVEELFAFCGLHFGSETRDFIGESRSRPGSDANSVYRLVRPDDAWRARLPKAIAESIIAELEGGPLARFLEDAIPRN